MMIYTTVSRWRCINKATVTISIALLVMLLLSACGGNPQTQLKANQNKIQLDTLLSHAQSIGVPGPALQPILNQEAQLNATKAPITVFSNQPATNYYTNLSQRYAMLSVEVQGLEYKVTQQSDYQAYQDIQKLENALTERQSQGFVEARTFAVQLDQYQAQLAKAQYPKDYIQISTEAQASTLALHLMGPAYQKLEALQQVIKQMQTSHMDTTALSQESQDDLQLFRAANGPEDFTRLIDEINAQLQEATVLNIQAIPYVGAAKLTEFNNDIQLANQYGVNVIKYQERLAADQAALSNAKTLKDYLKVATQIDNDVASIQIPLVQGQANYLLNQFHQEVTAWGNTHVYHDPQDGNNYHLDYEYGPDGIGSDADSAVQSAQTMDDYQAAIDLINTDMVNLHAMKADYSDTTPWNKPHATDLQLIQHYGLTGQVIVVSLVEQALRLYQDGKLVNAFQITSGQYAKPSPPGVWHILLRQSPTIFKSSEPVGSAFWYPDTNINYAMEYHDGGYYFHDSWWRVNYGPGTNFPHYDAGGDETFAGNGSHGCINMQKDQAGWLYAHTDYNTGVIIY
jgi:lipoprotein-anchoring transpeptidase ErfK/SrfK